MRRADLLDEMTHVEDGIRVFTEDASVRHLSKSEREVVETAFEAYLDTIPETKRFDRSLFYDLRDVVGKSGFGIGSAGLPAYNLLVEGFSQALDNDVVLSMKMANIPALSRFVDTAAVEDYFDHEGHRTVVSQRALQVHTDPLLGYAEIDGVGYVVSEVSPYDVDLDWGNITEPDDIAAVVDLLGRATAKVHCASDEDSDQDLVDFQVEQAIVASLKGRRRAFADHLVEFGLRTPRPCAGTTPCSWRRSGTAGSAWPPPDARVPGARLRGPADRTPQGCARQRNCSASRARSGPPPVRPGCPRSRRASRDAPRDRPAGRPSPG